MEGHLAFIPGIQNEGKINGEGGWGILYGHPSPPGRAQDPGPPLN